MAANMPSKEKVTTDVGVPFTCVAAATRWHTGQNAFVISNCTQNIRPCRNFAERAGTRDGEQDVIWTHYVPYRECAKGPSRTPISTVHTVCFETPLEVFQTPHQQA